MSEDLHEGRPALVAKGEPRRTGPTSRAATEDGGGGGAGGRNGYQSLVKNLNGHNTASLE